MDMRDDINITKQLAATGHHMVTKAEAENLQKEIGAVCYCECSALSQEGLKNVFEQAIGAALNKNKKNTCCVLL